ncbi:dimethylmenaquinone methyltransferase [Sphingobacterium sp. DK4209]|uniref:Putative 4-hydroxy-4-methyl-2-oxoglutarate aldolase n=1 Tax=Sphingobacterium zhuxiongii TaxID=2662364 RepID=A0A5Q0Q761_9SPHI|nr:MULTISPECIES: dimethylmenaquinone methyltransferase [unclassified Sphingobacterium]MVZ64578.1 dimethylmenaquinone methyltransferase [Sphingobacterium sp. DK4209]QGA25905.1 dimethylmenaquinone methyltransferase [Sphingobacterium sp. dk4302]
MEKRDYPLRKFEVNYNAQEIAERFKKLYTGLVYDAMESVGLKGRAMDSGVYPLVHTMKVAGHAFTMHGKATPNMDTYTHNIRLGLMKSMSDGCIQIRDTQGNLNCGQFGEISATAAAAVGCVGAVIDGSTRDSNILIDMDFPTFCRFRNPVEAYGRFMIVDYQIPIFVKGIDGMIVVNPGDYIFGDNDGVVVVPYERTIEILEMAEEWFAAEARSRKAMADGRDPFDVYDEYGRF